MKRLGRCIATVSALLLAFAAPVWAQINIGSLSGVVTDASGSVVPGVEVVVTETSTKVTHRTVTDTRGSYTILVLPKGTYELTVSHEGFATSTLASIELNAGDHKSADVKLTVGNVSQKVEVTGAPPALETETGQYSESVDAKALINLPVELNDFKRSAVTYLTALPGFQANAGFDNGINGSVLTYSELYIDGSPTELSAASRGLFQSTFSNEAVAEIKVVQTPMADLGQSGGAAISITTQQGTNALHGSAYTYLRNTAFDSRCETCTTVANDHQEEYGFSVGGPVFIPKVYDGRNKSFFWFNWGHMHFNYSAGGNFYGVPTDAWKQGNFSDLLGAQIGTDDLGRPIDSGAIYNPLTTRTLPDGSVIRDPFPGNIIPPNLFSSISSKYQAFFPEANRPGDTNNYFTNGGLIGAFPDTYFQVDVNQNIGAKDRVFGTYWHDYIIEIPAYQLPPFFQVYEITTPGITGNLTHLNWTHTVNPSLINELTAGLDRQYTPDDGTPTANMGASLIGQTGALGACTPSVAIPNIIGSATGTGTQCAQVEGDTNYTINDNLSKLKDKHFIKWGFNLLRFNDNYLDPRNGYFTYRAGQTGLPNQPGSPNSMNQTGAPYASFLLGTLYSANVAGETYSSPRILQYGFYAQDTFKITSKLTLQYGLRYDVSPFPVEDRNRISQFSATAPNPAAGGIPGALTFDGFGPGTLNRRQLVPTYYLKSNWAPKIGFAYHFQKDSVFRGAWTWGYGPPNQTAQGFVNEYQQGYFPAFSATSSNGYDPAYYWDNGFPFPAGVPLYNNFNPSLYNGSSTGYFGADADHSPRVENVHIDVQHEFPGRVVVMAAYNGTYAHGIINGTMTQINQLNYSKYGSLGNLLTDDINSPAARAANIPIPYPGFQGSVANALTPFPQYAVIEDQSSTNASSIYTAGQFTAQKQYSNGLSFLVGFTVERQYSQLDNAPGAFTAAPQDAYNTKAEWAPAVENIPKQLLLNYTYELPVGRGKQLNVRNRALDAAVGGWSIAGVHTYQSGGPIEPHTELSLPGNVGTVRPNIVPGVPIRTGVGCGNFNIYTDRYLNKAAFSDPAPFSFGNAPRAFGGFTSCALFNENVSLFKTFNFTEKVKFKLGGDFFNLFNRHQWRSPNADTDSAAFGQITGQGNSPRQLQVNGRLIF